MISFGPTAAASRSPMPPSRSQTLADPPCTSSTLSAMEKLPGSEGQRVPDSIHRARYPRENRGRVSIPALVQTKSAPRRHGMFRFEIPSGTYLVHARRLTFGSRPRRCQLAPRQQPSHGVEITSAHTVLKRTSPVTDYPAMARTRWRGWRTELKLEGQRLVLALIFAAAGALVIYLGLLTAAHRLTR